MRKSQSSTSYLSVWVISIIIISLVLLALFRLGVFNPNYDAGSATELGFQAKRVGILDHSLKTNGVWTIEIINRNNKNVEIKSISIDGHDFSFSRLIGPGKRSYLSGFNSELKGEFGEQYRYNLSIRYKSESGLEHMEQGAFSGFYEMGDNSFVWFTGSESDFDNGTYINTTYGSVRLSGSNSTGMYISGIYDAGSNVTWISISWSEDYPYGEAMNPDADTLLLYHFDENYGTIVDSSCYGNNGTDQGASYGAPGVFDKAMHFDGNEKVQVSESASLGINDTLSYGAWFKPDSFSTWAGVMSRMRTWGHGYNLQVGTNKKIACGWGVYTESDSAPQLDRWYHAVCVYNGTCMKLYVNGQLQNDVDCGQLNVSQEDMVIGVFYTSSSLYFNGTIDEVFVYNRTLSNDEIRALYVKGAARLNASVRSCDDASCSGEPWSSAYENADGSNLSVPDNRYFQYRFSFLTDDLNYSPVLHNVSVRFKVS